MEKSKDSRSLNRWEIFRRLLPLPYFLTATFSHDLVSTVYTGIFNQFGRTTMEWALHRGSVLLLGITLAAAFLYMRITRTFRTGNLPVWMITLLLLVCIDRFLICTNIERIHFPQYAILAFLLRMTVKDDFLVLFLCTLGGIFDEWMQYVMYPKYTGYLDFNDFILNLGGAALGLLVFGVFKRESDSESSSYTRKIELVTYTGTAVVLLLLMIGCFSGRIVPYMPKSGDLDVFMTIDGKLRMVLSFVETSQFWEVTKYGRKYHILSPLEGMAIMTFLLFLYARLFSRSRKEGRENSEETTWRASTSLSSFFRSLRWIAAGGAKFARWCRYLVSNQS